MTTPMTDERLDVSGARLWLATLPDGNRAAWLRILLHEHDEIDRLRAEVERLTSERDEARHLVKALRQMVRVVDEAGKLFVTVELARGGEAVLKAADTWLSLESDGPTCDGCGAVPTAAVDADGNHLCWACGLAALEDA